MPTIRNTVSYLSAKRALLEKLTVPRMVKFFTTSIDLRSCPEQNECSPNLIVLLFRHFLRRNAERIMWRPRACVRVVDLVSVSDILMDFDEIRYWRFDKNCPANKYVTFIFYVRLWWTCTCSVHRLWPIVVRFDTEGPCKTVERSWVLLKSARWKP
jgi:hypothetical protein